MALVSDAPDGGGVGFCGFETIVFEPGYEICVEGEHSDCCYIIKDGEAEVLRRNGARHVRVARLVRGQIFGEMSMITGEPCSATVRAASTVECYLIWRDDVRRMLNLDNRFNAYLLRALVRRVQRMTTLAFGIKESA